MQKSRTKRLVQPCSATIREQFSAGDAQITHYSAIMDPAVVPHKHSIFFFLLKGNVLWANIKGMNME